MAASVIASRVVGTRTTRTPRSQVAPTKPARSVGAPPPTPTIASLRVTRCPPSRGPRRDRFGVHEIAGAGEGAAHRPRDRLQPLRVDNDARAHGAYQQRQLAEHP